MKKLVICVMYDLKGQCYGKPFFCKSEGDAVRGFSAVVNDHSNESLISKYPEDFTLFIVGEFDPESGDVLPLVNRKSFSALSYVKIDLCNND